MRDFQGQSLGPVACKLWIQQCTKGLSSLNGLRLFMQVLRGRPSMSRLWSVDAPGVDRCIPGKPRLRNDKAKGHELWIPHRAQGPVWPDLPPSLLRVNTGRAVSLELNADHAALNPFQPERAETNPSCKSSRLLKPQQTPSSVRFRPFHNRSSQTPSAHGPTAVESCSWPFLPPLGEHTHRDSCNGRSDSRKRSDV